MRSAYCLWLSATVLLALVLCDHDKRQQGNKKKAPSVGSSGGLLEAPHHVAHMHLHRGHHVHKTHHVLGHGHTEEHVSHHHHHHHHQKPTAEDNITCHKIAPYLSSFSFSLFNLSTSADNSHNIIFSPVGIATTFAMLSLGARHETLNEIWQGLHFDDRAPSMETIHDAFHNLIDMLNDPPSDLHLIMGSALFIKQDLKLLQLFVENIKNQYGSEAFSINFEDTEKSKKVINDFVSMETKGTIIDLISSLNQKTLMLLVSYVFFRGQWMDPFEVANTKEDDFHVDENTVVKVQMMYRFRESKNYYDQGLGCTVIHILYKGNATALFILPDQGTWDMVQKSFSTTTINRWIISMHLSIVELYIPKFSISHIIDQKKDFAKMDFRNIFSDQADFSGITGQPNLKLSEAVHKATLIIDENGGTDAAETTAINITQIGPPTTIKFNRPFLFSIYQETVRATLFIGRIVNPNEQ